ncbi:MAG: UxaA family hydrolase [Desulfovibrio sp.]|uniref:UxaA family hydrolase n=1 Tax=Desulfovibrio sp. TaxID=885 RepID=UPI0025B8F48D|nr:UxaA family hydrolase [Desulfovibrio sp.]MCI7568825.1 UxaA family hydrolase [Desulfovibrio sp.]
MEFMGYVRPDGKVGSRNHVAVIPTVVCAADVAQAIVRQVPGTVGFFHHQGCCQLPPDLDRVTKTLAALGCSPNVGAALVVSLGCEGTDHQQVFEAIRATGKPVEIIHIQELGGPTRGIQVGMDAARRLVCAVSGLQRQPVDVSNIVMSIKCGASDSTSGMASNCVIGYVADKVVDCGGTVLFGETTEFLGAEHILARRAVSEEVGRKILHIVDRMEQRAKSLGCDMRKGQPTPGNIAGGLSTIEEKSLGAIMKSGSRPIQGVLEYDEMVTTQKGLWIKDTPGREPEILTGMGCSGAQCMLFSTGRGAPQGFPSMPVVKICGNPHTFEHMREDMDLNAGCIIEGGKSIEEVGEEAFALLLRTLNGAMTRNEAIGYISAIDIYTLGPVI